MLNNTLKSSSITPKRFHRVVPSNTLKLPSIITKKIKYPQATTIEMINSIATNPAIHYTAKSILIFTMIYCGLNYMMYREVNREIEDDNNNKDK